MNNPDVEILGPARYGQWDAFVDLSPQGDIFCYSWWLDAITKSNFKILVILQRGEIVAGIPIAMDEQGKADIPPLIRTLGVLYKPQEDFSGHTYISAQRQWLSALLEHLPLEGFVQMCMHHNFTDWLPFRWKGLQQTTLYTYIIQYQNKTTACLWNDLNRGRKETINRAIKNGISVEETDDLDLVYHFETLSFERKGLEFSKIFKPQDLKILDEQIKKNGKRTILKAFDKDGHVHATIYIVYNQKSAYALLTGSDPQYRKIGGHTLVMWEAIKFFRDKVGYFNFGGSNMEQIEAHLRGFGGVLTPYFLIYNENFSEKKNSIRYHLGATLFHLYETCKIIKNTISGIISVR
jgi:hypothetical protein